ncbi:GTPase [uncultured Brachyspira sp.]|uniref:GTPase n=1 Tax=uncultured Brachyspira sp. TaxID=221953 RepID=UPI0026380B7D|nr:GTPase [uncultured Brachyspira sp.]
MSENNQKFNLLILGQRGVGKSSLINALVGHEVEITGTGKPIAARGIFPYETSIDGKDVVIYNSYGLEVDKIEEWERIIRNELYIRCNDIKDRFHSVTYCIQAGGFKIQYFDIKIIKQFIENQYDVVIALTKADQIEESLRKEFIDIIKEETGVEQVIPIAASPDKLRGMTETPSPFGLEEYKRTIFRICKRNALENYIELNMLILGQTGVGKSSLINVLVGYEVEKTGVGKPITKRGIFPHETSINGKDVVIYDSWGLEVGKDKEWEQIIKDELKRRGVDKDIKDWFHSVTYCINAGGDKIQDFDINIIKQFIEEKYDVVIALTKADQISEDKEKEFIEIIKNVTGVKKVIPIAASPDKLRGMTETPSPLGLDDYQIAVLESWKQMFIERVPIYISEKIKNDLENKRYELINKYKKYNLNDNVLKSSITEEIEQFFKDEILLYIKDTIKAYYNIQIDIVSLNSGMLINNARYNFHQYSFYKDNFFNMDFENIFDLLFNIGFFKFLFTLGIFLPFIGLPLAIVGGIFTIFGGKIKEAQREKFINELIDKLKYQIVGKDYILNIKNAIIKCLEETDKKLSEYSQN